MASAAKGMQSAGNAAGGAAKQMERPGRRWLDSTRLRRWKPRMPAQAVAGAVELAAQTSITMPPWIWDTSPINEKLAGIFDVRGSLG